MNNQRLKREVGAGGAVLLGLGSMVGAGVFVSVGVVIDIAGPSACLAVALAALLALCNGLSSAQLAAAHPVSGGTYEYGYRQLNAWWGFSAGWLFLCAKSASAATAAIGFAQYAFPSVPTLIPAAATVAVLTAVTLTGLRRSNRVNAVLVTIVMAGLVGFAAVGLYRSGGGAFSLKPFFESPAGEPVNLTGFLEAAALMFVAYTGYGRVATLGEEIRDPRRSIPRAVIAVMAVTMALYALVTIVAAGYGGGSPGAEGGLLSAIARGFGSPTLAAALTVAAGVARRRPSRPVAALPAGAASPAEWLLTRAESAASSTIEGVRPSARRLARAEAQLALGGQPPPYQDREALGNVSATRLALEMGAAGGTVTIEDLCSIHAALMGSDPEAGQMRTRQNWMGAGLSSTPLNASFVPPPPEAVPSLVEDLVAAMNEPARSPLVHAAVVHAQFETIHPFADGNGRTGRALVQLMLRRSGLATACSPPISSALALDRDAYIGALRSNRPVCVPDDPRRSAALTAWIELCADACSQACDYTQRIVSHVSALQQDWRNRLIARGVRRSNSVMRLIDVLPSNPVLNAASAADLLAVDPRTARRSIDLLVAAGILVQRSAGRRNRVYEVESVIDTLAVLARGAFQGPSLNTPPTPKADDS